MIVVLISPPLSMSIRASTQILSANSSKASVTIGQAHVDGISGHCSIFVELMWTDGTVTAHLRDKSCGNVNVVVGTGCACCAVLSGNKHNTLTHPTPPTAPHADR